MEARPPRHPARAHHAFRLGLLIIALLVACVAMTAAADTAFAQSTGNPVGSSTGHHVVHDLHCESFTGPAATAKQACFDEAPALDSAKSPADSPDLRTETSGFPVVGSHPPGRALLLTIGVDRN
ncbi:MAG: hypothetical protein EKK42_33335 [Pseudonocardiaceae bacterium]|jgi:hypothetical protein|nr:MAG: hypothetical protein EKK42_33335 [Pseudonocardiaceae bacterium]